MKSTFYKGAMGNLSLHTVTVALSALAVSATEVLAEFLPVGTEVTGVRVISEALGASTAIKVDLVDKAGATKAVLPSTATVSAVTSVTPLKPVYIGDEGESDLVLTNSGTGVATGEVTIQLEYRFKGY